MLIADTDGMCVDLGTPGVPHDGGIYGKPRWFAREMAKLDYVIGWNVLWHRFDMFRRQSNGRLIYEWGFSTEGGFGIMPITEEHAMVFKHLRAVYPTAKTILDANRKMVADEADKVEREHDEQFDLIEDEVTRKTDLKMGLVTPKVSVIVPAGHPAMN